MFNITKVLTLGMVLFSLISCSEKEDSQTYLSPEFESPVPTIETLMEDSFSEQEARALRLEYNVEEKSDLNSLHNIFS